MRKNVFFYRFEPIQCLFRSDSCWKWANNSHRAMWKWQEWMVVVGQRKRGPEFLWERAAAAFRWHSTNVHVNSTNQIHKKYTNSWSFLKSRIRLNWKLCPSPSLSRASARDVYDSDAPNSSPFSISWLERPVATWPLNGAAFKRSRASCLRCLERR